MSTDRSFQVVGIEDLDEAFPDELPAPDYLAQECEMAERALMSLSARLTSTRDMKLSQLFAVPHAQPTRPASWAATRARPKPALHL
jgi:hypothetical protein